MFATHQSTRPNLDPRPETGARQKDAADAKITPVADLDRAVAQGSRGDWLSGRRLGMYGGEHQDTGAYPNPLTDVQSAQALQVRVRGDQGSVPDLKLAVGITHQDRKRLDRHIAPQTDARRLHDDAARMDDRAVATIAQDAAQIVSLSHGSDTAGRGASPSVLEDHNRVRRANISWPMEMNGRVMRGWLRVDADALRTERQLRAWISIGTTTATNTAAKG